MPEDVAMPFTSEAAENRRSPAMKSRCVPNRSAARPPSSRKPPKTSVYALTTHWRPVGEKCRPRSMLGRATFTIVASRITINWATQTRTKTSQRFVEAAVIERNLLRGFLRYPFETSSPSGLIPRGLAWARLSRRHADLLVCDVRHPIRPERRTAARLPDLPRRAPVRRPRWAAVDDL